MYFVNLTDNDVGIDWEEEEGGAGWRWEKGTKAGTTEIA